MVSTVLRTNTVKKKIISDILKKQCEKSSDLKVRVFIECWSIIIDLLFKIVALNCDPEHI